MPFRVKKQWVSEDKGLGVIAKQFIAKGSLVLEYGGSVCSEERGRQVEIEYGLRDPPPGCYMFFVRAPHKLW
jgi:SET domain-containing protein